MDTWVRETLEALEAEGLRRVLTARGPGDGVRFALADGREVVGFASNDYLGLAGHPRVREAARRAIDRWGWGAGASRLVAGHTDAHAALEADLAAFKHTEAALVSSTGYQANLGLVAALAGRGDAVVMDRANHASLVDAARLSGARLLRYRHADAADAARCVAKAREAGAGRVLLVTDTVFSMDGDLAPLGALSELAEETGARLLLDEAHATGVLGPTGAGLAEAVAAAGHRLAVTASVGTLSKALGGLGGFVAADRGLVDLLVTRARAFMYTTALPPAACEAARAALALVRDEPARRARVLALAEALRTRLRDAGLAVPRGATPLVPIPVGDPGRAVDLAGRLLAEGLFCPAIRPPTVPPRTSRLRVSLSASHTEQDVVRLAEALVRHRALLG